MLKKSIFTLLALMACTLSFAEIIEFGGLYYSLGTTTAQVVKDQTSDKSLYSTYTTVTIAPSVTYNNYTYPVTSIGTSAFEALTNLQSVTLPPSITTIGTYAFEGCSKLGSVNLEEGLTTINTRAFYGCNLSSVTIPSTVTSIGTKAFQSNPITSVVWKPATCSIGTDSDAPFYSTNSQITSFIFADGVQTVPAYICKNMSKLETVVLPSSVSSLGQSAFMYCTSLKSINLPVTQKTLPVSFFEGCTALETIELPATLTTISNYVFDGCSKLSNVNLHEGLTTINTRAFYGCNLSSVTIPSTVTTLGTKAFQSNPLTSVVWLPAECSTGTDSDAPFYSTNSQITSFTFGDNVKIIPSYLCKNMSKLETVTIPASVTNIYRNAFMYCTGLKSFEFPKGLVTVATSVLEGCTALQSVVIPSSVTTINTDAFYGCSGLQEIYNYAFTPQTIAERTVNNVNKSTCILYVPIDYIDLYKAKEVWKDFLNIIGVATDLQFDEQTVQVTYLKEDGALHYMEAQTWQVPHAPRIEGFTFLKWQVLEGNLADGIVLQAVYEKNDPQDLAPVNDNSSSALSRKLICNGNVYILRDDNLFTITGAKVK